MVSHREVAESWIRGHEANGSRMFTDGNAIWSYGKHFPIAFCLKDGRVLFNTDKYSSSTSHHQTIVMRVIDNYIECKTHEIVYAIEHPNDPIIIHKEKAVQSINDAIELIYKYAKQEGVRRFPKQKIENILKPLVQKAREEIRIVNSI